MNVNDVNDKWEIDLTLTVIWLGRILMLASGKENAQEVVFKKEGRRSRGDTKPSLFVDQMKLVSKALPNVKKFTFVGNERYPVEGLSLLVSSHEDALESWNLPGGSDAGTVVTGTKEEFESFCSSLGRCSKLKEFLVGDGCRFEVAGSAEEDWSPQDLLVSTLASLESLEKVDYQPFNKQHTLPNKGKFFRKKEDVRGAAAAVQHETVMSSDSETDDDEYDPDDGWQIDTTLPPDWLAPLLQAPGGCYFATHVEFVLPHPDNGRNKWKPSFLEQVDVLTDAMPQLEKFSFKDDHSRRTYCVEGFSDLFRLYSGTLRIAGLPQNTVVKGTKRDFEGFCQNLKRCSSLKKFVVGSCKFEVTEGGSWSPKDLFVSTLNSMANLKKVDYEPWNQQRKHRLEMGETSTLNKKQRSKGGSNKSTAQN